MPRRAGLRDEIVPATIALARAQTFAGTTIDDIAHRLGVTKAAVYYHFPAKEQILASVVGPLLEAMEQLVDTASEPDSPLRDPRSLMRAYLDVLVEHRDVVPLVVQDASVINHPVLAGRPDGVERRLRELLVASLDGASAAEPRASAALAALRRPVVELPAGEVRRHRRALLAAAAAALGLGSRKGEADEPAASENDAGSARGWQGGQGASFPASPAGVRAARAFVRQVLLRSPVDDDVVETAALLASEMVAYVLANSDPDRDVRVNLVTNEGWIGFEVANDDVLAAPACGSLDAGVGRVDAAPGPRPVAVVDALAGAWGIERRRGERVRFWAELPIARWPRPS